MKKCLGCGVILQDQDPKAKGYVNSLDQDYCKRCFRLMHYGDSVIDLRSDIKRADVIKLIKSHDKPVALIADILNVSAAFKDDLLEALKGRQIILVFNKYDLLPKNTNIRRIEEYLETMVSEKFKDAKVLDILITHHKDVYFKKLFMETLDRWSIKEVMFVGNVNAGKSTIINKLLESTKLTVSYYPSTTLNINEVALEEHLFYDTPGLLDENNLGVFISEEKLKDITIKKTIKPLVYQLYDKQSYFIEGLLRIDVLPKEKGSIIFYIADGLKIHRSKLEKGDDYQTKHLSSLSLYLPFDHLSEYDLKGKSLEFEIDGLGIIGFKNIAKIKIHHDQRIRINVRKSVL